MPRATAQAWGPEEFAETAGTGAVAGRVVVDVRRSLCHRARLLSPTMVATDGARAAGTDGAVVAVYAAPPEASFTADIVVAKAPEISATVPVAGISRPSGEVGPTANPWPASQVRTETIADRPGPKRGPNCPGAR